MTQHRLENQPSPKQKKLSSNDQSNELTFLEHIHEVRKRVFWIALVLVVASAIGFQFKDHLISVVMMPLHGEKLIYLTPGGGFSFIFTLCLYFGILFTIPVVIYQIFRFLQPIIGKTSRKFIAGFLMTSVLLAAAGALFGYFVTIPAALTFLSAFAGSAVTPSLTADSYLNFVVTYIVGLALIFQLPLLLFIVDHIRPFPPGMLTTLQRPVIVGATILAAFITPTPDAFNMAVVGLPIVFVYEVGATAVFVRRHGRRNNATTSVSLQQKSEDLADEPLTEIIQELQQQPTPMVVQEAAVQKPVSPAITPVAAPVQSRAPQRRVVDGFTVRQRQTPVRTLEPARPLVQRTVVPVARTQSNRPLRSIDGMIVG